MKKKNYVKYPSIVLVIDPRITMSKCIYVHVYKGIYVIHVLYFYYITINYSYHYIMRIERVFWDFYTHPVKGIFRLLS